MAWAKRIVRIVPRKCVLLSLFCWFTVTQEASRKHSNTPLETPVDVNPEWKCARAHWDSSTEDSSSPLLWLSNVCLGGELEGRGGGHWDVAVLEGWRLAEAATCSALLPSTQEGDVQIQPRSEAASTSWEQW